MARSLIAIGVLGGAGLFLSDLPVGAAIALAPAVAAWGAVLARRSMRMDPVGFVLGSDGRVHVDGVCVGELALAWQGPLTRIQWRDGARRARLVAWPDVIPAAQRRELRLWRLVHRADASTRPVAP